MTLPAKLRRLHGIKEGDLLTIEARKDSTIVMKLKKPLEPGRPVGSEEQKRILNELKKLRESWR